MLCALQLPITFSLGGAEIAATRNRTHLSAWQAPVGKDQMAVFALERSYAGFGICGWKDAASSIAADIG